VLGSKVVTMAAQPNIWHVWGLLGSANVLDFCKAIHDILPAPNRTWPPACMSAARIIYLAGAMLQGLPCTG
jgi:hypothetical protein